MWYEFNAYNQETRVGWTRAHAVAQAALDWLNKGREINVYTMSCLGDNRPDLEAWGTGYLFDDDTAPEDFAD